MKLEFKNNANGFNEIKKAIIIRTIPLAIIASGAGLFISYYNLDGQTSDTNVLSIVIPLMIIALAIGLFKGLKRQKELFTSYRLTITDSEIIREQKNTPQISIPFSEVRSIVKGPKGTITVVGNSSINVIIIPSHINDKEKLEQLLANILPISLSNNKSSIEKYRWVLSIFVLGLMVSVYLSTNKLIVGVSGLLLIILFGYSFYKIRNNKNVDKKTKRSMWWGLLVVLSIIGVMYSKLTGKL